MARHMLHDRAASVTEAADAMIALHATDPTTVYLSAWARTRCAGLAEVDAALYAERGIVRMLGMRRTMFVVPAPLAAVVQRACTDDVAARLRRGLERDLARGGPGGISAIGQADPAPGCGTRARGRYGRWRRGAARRARSSRRTSRGCGRSWSTLRIRRTAARGTSPAGC